MGRKYSLCFDQDYHLWPWPNTKCRTDAEGGSLWELQKSVDLVSLKCGAEAGWRDPFPLSLHQVYHCVFPGSVLPRTAAQTAVGGLWGSTWKGFSRGPEAAASLGRVPGKAALGDTQKWWEGPGETAWEILLPSDSSWVKPPCGVAHRRYGSTVPSCRLYLPAQVSLHHKSLLVFKLCGALMACESHVMLRIQYFKLYWIVAK